VSRSKLAIGDGDRATQHLLLSSSKVELHVKFMMATSNSGTRPQGLPSFEAGRRSCPIYNPGRVPSGRAQYFLLLGSWVRASFLLPIRRLTEKYNLGQNRFVSRHGSLIAGEVLSRQDKGGETPFQVSVAGVS